MTENKQWPTRAQFDALKSRVDQGSVNAEVNADGYLVLNQDDPLESPPPPGVTAETLVAEAVNRLRQPQAVDGFKYASPEFNYDSARDGWKIKTWPLPQSELDKHFTSSFSLGIPQNTFPSQDVQRSAPKYAVHVSSWDGLKTSPCGQDVTYSTTFEITEEGFYATSLTFSGRANDLAPVGVDTKVSGTLTLKKDGVVIASGEDTYSLDTNNRGWGLSVPLYPELPLERGVYTVEGTVWPATANTAWTQLNYLTNDKIKGWPLPGVTESYRLLANGVDVGQNMTVGVGVRAVEAALAKPVTTEPQGDGSIIVTGHGPLGLALPVADVGWTTIRKTVAHSIVEFTLENTLDERFSFSVWPWRYTQDTPALKGSDIRNVFNVSFEHGYVSNDPDVSAQPVFLVNANYWKRPEMPPRLRWESRQYWADAYDSNSQLVLMPHITYTLYNAETGEIIMTTTRREDRSAGNASFDPPSVNDRTLFYLTCMNRADGLYPTTTSTPPEGIPFGSRVPARVRIHRWMEWRETKA